MAQRGRGEIVASLATGFGAARGQGRPHRWWAICAFVWLLSGTDTARAVGVHEASAPDPDDRPLPLRIWFPTEPGDEREIKGDALPLIIVSHGTGGSSFDHEDTARALAEAGFVVAAVTHSGDNYRDQSYVARGQHLFGRPRHIARAVDFMLTAWSQHRHIDPERIGLFGFSAGGFTALVVVGGKPDLSRTVEHCRQNPDAWDCTYLRKRMKVVPDPSERPDPGWLRDPRIKAAVVAAPAIGYSFDPDGLTNVRVPLQLWAAERDTIVDDSAATVRQLLTNDPEYQLVPNAGHFSFLAPCTWSKRILAFVYMWLGNPNICADPDGFDRSAFHQAFARSVTAFFSATLPSPGQ